MVHRQPFDPLLSGQDSGRKIRLSGDFSKYCHTTPANVLGEYRVHRESLRRGVSVERWTVRGAPWEMMNWHVWCWRKDKHDALRVYLQIILAPEDDTAEEYLQSEAFPSSITVLPDEAGTPIVRVEFETTGKPRFKQFACEPYGWCRSYCRSYPGKVEEIGPEGDLEEAIRGPTTLFAEEWDFELSRRWHELGESISQKDALLSKEERSLSRAKSDTKALSEQVRELRERLELADASRLETLILQTLPHCKKRDFEILALNYLGKKQADIMKIMKLSRSTVSSALNKMEGFGFPVQRRGKSHTYGRRSRLSPRSRGKRPGVVDEDRPGTDLWTYSAGGDDGEENAGSE